MGNYVAIRNSYGLKGRFWKKGDLVSVLDDDLSNSAMKHFEKFEKKDFEKPFQDQQGISRDPLQIQNEMIAAKIKPNIEIVRSKYLEYFRKEVPVNKKNDINWIKAKLKEVGSDY